MNRDSAVAEIKQAFGFRKSLDTIAVTGLINSQQEMEKLPSLPWFLESELTMTQTVAPTTNPDGTLTYEERLPLPSDFLREIDDSPLQIMRPHDTDFVDLEKRDWDYIQRGIYRNDRRHHSWVHLRHGVPRMYAMSANYFRLRPYPDESYPIRFKYYQKDQTLETNIENLWLQHYPYLLIGRAIVRIASGGTRDQEAVALGNQMQQDALQSMIQETEWRTHTNRRYAMGQDQ